MNISLQLQQQQKLVMTTQMQQAFMLLQLSGMELEDALRSEVEENPALEMADNQSALDDAEQGIVTQHKEQIAEELEARNGSEEGTFDWQQLLENGKAVSDRSSGMSGGMIYSELPPIEQNYSVSPQLIEHLMEQFRLELSTDLERVAGELIINSLNQYGHLELGYQEILDILCRDGHKDIELDDVEGAVLIIRELEPIGCAARSVTECLQFQAEINYPEDPFFSPLIRDHLSLLSSRRFDEVADLEDMDPEDVKEYHSMLQEFNPKPGNLFSDGVEHGITPDVTIRRDGDQWVVLTNDSGLPRVRLNATLRALIKDGTLKGKDRRFADDKLRKAQFIIESLYRREHTLLRVTRAILERQLEFFEFGEEFLRPLVLRQIAEDVSLHESTISRTTSNKYVDTPYGVMELKTLFCSGVSGMYGEEYAAEAIKFKIKRLISEEDKKRPLSDNALMKKLHEEGILIARRTVAKYREAIFIPSSRERKDRG